MAFTGIAFRRRLVWILAIGVCAMASGCTTLVQREYFEPSGLDTVVDWSGPKSVAFGNIDGARITIRADVTKSRQVKMRLTCELPAGAALSFSSDRARVVSEGVVEEIKLSWLERPVKDGVGGRAEIPFTAVLKPRSFATGQRTPREGIVDMGYYETTFTLPDRLSQVDRFVFVIPAPVGHSEIPVEFHRKTARYLDFGGPW